MGFLTRSNSVTLNNKIIDYFTRSDVVIPQHLPRSACQDLFQRHRKTLLRQILRLIQYLTLHSVDHPQKGAAHNVYLQMRRTRKILRFLRTLQHTTQIRKEVSSLLK